MTLADQEEHAGEARIGAARDLPIPPFKPRRRWIGGDLQTVRNFVTRPEINLSPWPGKRLWLPVEGGDELAAALNGAEYIGQRPLIFLVHGLTGCEDSIYLRRTTREWLQRGYPVLRINLRGSKPSRPRCRDHYHAGRSEDLRDALCRLIEMEPAVARTGIVTVGVSLGGNVLIKLLAEHGEELPIRAAATVSAPIDLMATSHRFHLPRNTLYHRWMLSNLKEEATARPAALSEEERRAIEAARTLYQFDNTFVAPRHGFADAEDYYTRCAGKRYLADVAVPLLAIHAADDPWIPGDAYSSFDWSRNTKLSALLAASGGHVGFHAADDEAPWHDRAIMAFVDLAT
ncbi:YheT family hydrolase [Ferruginivarius sediminum]|uniref:Alpha/beta fold hydrolase n=1 Tax=Ferruginivarius sediminum TaxID=2661937 RepID=A0A369T8Y4_9PROT|nr:alpha/beta fold hydrolase [Ferruginivarius sediminum]RDD60627.1 alpha/beta fold hydrolase [Ferruginivarius sediminum]